MASLALIGKYINGNSKDTVKIKSSIPQHENPNVNNIYDSNIIDNTAKKLATTIQTSRDKSQNPEATNVIPQYYNQLYDAKSKSNTNSKPDVVEHFQQSHKDHTLLSEYKNELKDDSYLATFQCDKLPKDEKVNNSFENQFKRQKFDSIDKPVSINDLNCSSDKKQILSLKRSIALDGKWSLFDDENKDMTYDIMDPDHFTHNNMNAFYKGNGMELNQYNARNMGLKLEIFSGSSKNYVPKHEIEAFFEPTKDMVNGASRGTQNNTEQLQSRMYVSRARNGERLFEPAMISPGLNLGYNEEGDIGYQDSYRPLPKTIDELRAANKPKLVGKGVTIQGQKGNNRPVQGPTIKRHPEKFVECKTDDLLPVGGAYTQHRAPENYDLHETNRALENLICKYKATGPAIAATKNITPEYLQPLVKTDKNVYKNPGPFNVKGNVYPAEYADASTILLYEQERDTTENTNYKGPVSQTNTGNYTEYADKPKTTIRQTTVNAKYTGGITGDYNAVRAVDYSDVPRDTVKQSTINAQYTGGITGDYNTVRAVDYSDVPRPTVKQSIVNNQHSGGVTGDYNTMRAVDFKDVPRTTVKQLTVNNQHTGGVTAEYNSVRAINYQDVPRTTIKQTVVNNQHTGGITGEYNAVRAIDFKDVPRTTGKETISDIQYGGMPNSGNGDAYLVTHCDAKTTNKETTSDIQYGGMPNSGNGDAYLVTHYDAPVTIRQTTSQTNYMGVAGAEDTYAPREYYDAYNMSINNSKQMAIAVNHAPTTTGAFSGPCTDSVNVHLRDPLLFSRDNPMYSQQSYSTPVQNSRTRYEMENATAERVNPYVLSSVSSNPLVNNVMFQHKYTADNMSTRISDLNVRS